MSSLDLPAIVEVPEEAEYDKNARFKYLMLQADPRIIPARLDSLVEVGDYFLAEVAKKPTKIGWVKKDLIKILETRGLAGNALPIITELMVKRAEDFTLESWTEAEPVALNTVIDKLTSPYFKDKAGFQVAEFVKDLMDSAHLAMNDEGRVCVYDEGVYSDAGWKLQWQTMSMLGNAWKSEYHNEAVKVLITLLYAKRRVLPDWTREPMLNLKNGMLDLRTGKLVPHDPKYLSSSQLAISWDAEAECPVYQDWLFRAVGEQMDALEEAVSQMLDQSCTPTKAVLLFGPSRSGKSTFLDLVKAVAGKDNTSAVTLHQLGKDRFAAANVYRKTLNVASDISAADVEDLSVFKMMTGMDLVHADRKYGQQFSFTNRALFAFSCNTVPRVSEGSRAYIARIVPIEFPKTFEGDEDTKLAAKLQAELPGILVRWAEAWKRRADRGGFLKVDAAVAVKFASDSDKVASFAAVAVSGPSESHPVPTRPLYRAFLAWNKEQAGRQLGVQTFNQRLSNVPGWRPWYNGNGSIRGWYVVQNHWSEYLLDDPDAPRDPFIR